VAASAFSLQEHRHRTLRAAVHSADPQGLFPGPDHWASPRLTPVPYLNPPHDCQVVLTTPTCLHCPSHFPSMASHLHSWAMGSTHLGPDFCHWLPAPPPCAPANPRCLWMLLSGMGCDYGLDRASLNVPYFPSASCAGKHHPVAGLQPSPLSPVQMFSWALAQPWHPDILFIIGPQDVNPSS
jgi:hypothetical protein